MGELDKQKKKSEKLPDNAYVDKQGSITTDPAVAYAVLPLAASKGLELTYSLMY